MRHKGPWRPPQATAAGFTSLLFNDDFDSSSTIAPTRAGTGFNWWPPTQGMPTLTVANSELTMTADFTPNGGGLASLLNTGVSPGPNVFRHVYFEARMKYPGSAPGSYVNGTGTWPSFWLLNSNWPNRSIFAEVDIMEAIPSPRSANQPCVLTQTIHNWTTNFASDTTPNNWQSGLNVPALPGGNPGTTDFSVYHKYGLLWVPDLLTWYFDDQPYITQDVSNAAGHNLEANTDPLFIIIGTGRNWTCAWDWIRVWG